jgi:hypothetical protein
MAYIENFFLGVQHSFKSNWIAEADVIHANSIHEYINTNLNRQDGEDSITYAGGGYGSFNAPNLNQAFFPNTYFNNLNYTTNRAGSGYNGFTTFVRKAFAQGYAFQVAYTYQKTIDLVSTVPGAQRARRPCLLTTPFDFASWTGLLTERCRNSANCSQSAEHLRFARSQVTPIRRSETRRP